MTAINADVPRREGFYGETKLTKKGRPRKGPGGRRHFTHKDYGLVHTPSLKRVALQLNYLDKDGSVCKVMPTWNYHSDEGKASAMKFAREERDRLLALPEYQAYLQRVFADITGKNNNMARVTPIAVPKTVEGLVGVHAKPHTKRLLSNEESSTVTIFAHGPKPDGSIKYRSWSVRKHGLSEALRKAAHWRAEFVGAEPPTVTQLATAERSVRQQFSHILAGLG